MKSGGLDPKPFPAVEPEEEDDPEGAKAKDAKDKSKDGNSKKPKKENPFKKSKAVKDPPVVIPAQDGAQVYKPEAFMNLMKSFIKEKRETEGMSFKQAREAWTSSKVRQDLINTMPVSEQKRRRFIK